MFETALDPSTASLYYYNGGTNGLTMIGGATRQSAASVLTMAGDAQLFGPFGHPLVSGCYGSTNDSTELQELFDSVSASTQAPVAPAPKIDASGDSDEL